MVAWPLHCPRTVGPSSSENFAFPLSRETEGTSLVAAAYRIESTGPVTAHQLSPLYTVTNMSNEGTLLLPVSALGKRYRVLSYPEQGRGHESYFSVVGISEQPTSVTFEMSTNTEPGDDIPQFYGRWSYTLEIQQYDVLSFEAKPFLDADLSGSLVTSDRLVAVFAGTQNTWIPADSPAGDHLEEQLPPVALWGTTHVAAKSKNRGGETNIWHIVSDTDGTVITTDPVLSSLGGAVTLDAGDVLQIETASDFVIDTSAPVMVAHYLTSYDYMGALNGDPSMIIVPPSQHHLTEHTFVAAPNFAEDSVTLVAPRGTVVTLDGVAVGAGQWVNVGLGNTWARAVVDIADGYHDLTSTAPVGLTVVGYDFYTSYGYSGGFAPPD